MMDNLLIYLHPVWICEAGGSSIVRSQVVRADVINHWNCVHFVLITFILLVVLSKSLQIVLILLMILMFRLFRKTKKVSLSVLLLCACLYQNVK